MAQNLDLRCVLISDPGTLGAGAKTRLESRIKGFPPHCVSAEPPVAVAVLSRCGASSYSCGVFQDGRTRAFADCLTKIVPHKLVNN